MMKLHTPSELDSLVEPARAALAKSLVKVIVINTIGIILLTGNSG